MRILGRLRREQEDRAKLPARPRALPLDAGLDAVRDLFRWFARKGADAAPSLVEAAASDLAHRCGIDGRTAFHPRGTKLARKVAGTLRSTFQALAEGMIPWHRFERAFAHARRHAAHEVGPDRVEARGTKAFGLALLHALHDAPTAPASAPPAA